MATLVEQRTSKTVPRNHPECSRNRGAGCYSEGLNSSTSLDDVIPTDAIEAIARHLLTTEQYFRLTIDLKKLKFVEPTSTRVNKDDDFVASVSLSYLTAPLFQSSDVFHAVQISRSSRDRSELLISDGFCSFRFENRLKWTDFARLFLPPAQSGTDSLANASSEEGMCCGESSADVESHGESAGAALPIFVRARLNKCDRKSVTIGVATLTFESFLARQPPVLEDLPPAFFENLVATSLPSEGLHSQDSSNSMVSADESSRRSNQGGFREFPVFEGLMKLPIITRESATIAGILGLGVAVDLMLHAEELSALLARSLHSITPLKGIRTAPVLESQVAHKGCTSQQQPSDAEEQQSALSRSSQSDSSQQTQDVDDGLALQRQVPGNRISQKSNSDSAPTSIFSFQNHQTRSARATLKREAGRVKDFLSKEVAKRRSTSVEVPSPTLADNGKDKHQILSSKGKADTPPNDSPKEVLPPSWESQKLRASQAADDGPLEGTSTGNVTTAPSPNTMCFSQESQMKQPALETITNAVGCPSASNTCPTVPPGASADQLLQCEMLLMKLAQEQAQNKFREEVRIVEARADERITEIRLENQQLKAENRSLEQKLVSFEHRLHELQKALENNWSLSPPSVRPHKNSHHHRVHSSLMHDDREQLGLPEVHSASAVHPKLLANMVSLNNVDCLAGARSRGENVLIATVEDLRRQNERLMELLLKQGGLLNGAANAYACDHSRACHAPSLPPFGLSPPPGHPQHLTTSSQPERSSSSKTTNPSPFESSWGPNGGSGGSAAGGGCQTPVQTVHAVHPIYHSPHPAGNKIKFFPNARQLGQQWCAGTNYLPVGRNAPTQQMLLPQKTSTLRMGRLPPVAKQTTTNSKSSDPASQKSPVDLRDAKGVRDTVKSGGGEYFQPCHKQPGKQTEPADSPRVPKASAVEKKLTKRESQCSSLREAGSGNSSSEKIGRKFHHLQTGKISRTGSSSKFGPLVNAVSSDRVLGRQKSGRSSSVAHPQQGRRRHQKAESASSSTSHEAMGAEQEGADEDDESSGSCSSIPSSPLSSRSKRLLAEHLKSRCSPG